MFSGQVPFKPSNHGSFSGSHALTQQIGDRLLLHPLRKEDAPALFALIDNNRGYLKPWMPWVDHTQTVEDSLQFVQDNQERAHRNGGFVTAICYSDRLVGLMDLHAIDWQNRAGALGYWLAKPYQGKGIMTRACRALLTYGFTALNLNRIEISCATENARSQAVAKRLGLTYEGTLREAEWICDRFLDHRLYSMLQRDWLARLDTHFR